MLSYEEVSEYLTYDPNVGGSCLVLKKTRGRRSQGSVMGDIRIGASENDVYWRVCILGYRTSAHRIVWLLNTKKWPEQYIDHIDGNSLNNRFENLRECTHKENHQNRAVRADNITGKMGVGKHSGKYRARIMVDGVAHYLGLYSSSEEAHKAYLEAKRLLHTFNPVPR